RVAREARLRLANRTKPARELLNALSKPRPPLAEAKGALDIADTSTELAEFRLARRRLWCGKYAQEKKHQQRPCGSGRKRCRKLDPSAPLGESNVRKAEPRPRPPNNPLRPLP